MSEQEGGVYASPFVCTSPQCPLPRRARAPPGTEAKPLIRLLCFPAAGTGAWCFHELQKAACNEGDEEDEEYELEIVPIELPGRSSRFREERLTSMKSVVEALLDEKTGIAKLVRNEVDKSTDMEDGHDNSRRKVRYATFGHSMGAWIAYALLQELRRRRTDAMLTVAKHEQEEEDVKSQRKDDDDNDDDDDDDEHLPLVMFASCNRAPHLAGRKHDVHPWNMHAIADNDDFWSKMAERYGESSMSPALKKLMTPLLRADFRVIETWNPTEADASRTRIDNVDDADALLRALDPLCVPVVAIGALQDNRYTPMQISAWSDHVAADDAGVASFAEEWVQGGHRYITEEQPAEILAVIRRHIERAVHADPS